MCRSNTDVFQS